MKSNLILLMVLSLTSLSALADRVAVVKDALYEEECGACHMTYQPAFLPERSWRKIMGSLDNHFGENAELDADTRGTLSGFLVAHAAESAGGSLSKKILKRTSDDTIPVRVSELSFFTREHREIPARLVKNNPKVKSFSRCEACHTKAASGSYREREINIPGHGRWDD